jgi:hypothetical protein
VVNFIEFQKKENIIHLQNNILLGSFASVWYKYWWTKTNWNRKIKSFFCLFRQVMTV